MATLTTSQHADANYLRGLVMVTFAGVCWSIGGLVVRLIESANEWQILFYRSFALCITLFFFIGIRHRGPIIEVFRRAGATAMLAGICLGTAYASWIFAMTHTTIANAMFLLASAPFITAALAWVIIGERVRRITMGCMLVALCGVTVMVIEGAAIGKLAGNILGLGAALGFSLFTVLLRRSKAVDMTPAVFWSGVWGCTIGATMIALTQSGFEVPHRDFELCALLGFVQVGLGLIIYTLGSKHVPAAELALLSLTEVILGPIWVWLGVGEVPSLYTVIGGLVVLSAIVIQATIGIKRRRPPVGVAN